MPLAGTSGGRASAYCWGPFGSSPGCISAFVQHDVLLVCIPAFAGVGLILLLALPAQKKKKALMEQQLGGFFRTELTRALPGAADAGTAH